MQNLQKYFEQRKEARTPTEDIAGRGNVPGLAGIWKQDGEQLTQVCEAILHQACMSTAYDHNEIQIFKTGLFALVKFLSECNDEVEAEQKLEELKRQNKNKQD